MRRITCINQNWNFTGPDEKMQPVHIPHTWNALDGQDGGNDYVRGEFRYEKTFAQPDYNPEEEEVIWNFKA